MSATDQIKKKYDTASVCQSYHTRLLIKIGTIKLSFVCQRLQAEIEEAQLKAKEEMMQGIQMAKEVAQKELSDQKVLYEDRIRALEKELVQEFSFIKIWHLIFLSCYMAVCFHF